MEKSVVRRNEGMHWIETYCLGINWKVRKVIMELIFLPDLSLRPMIFPFSHSTALCKLQILGLDSPSTTLLLSTPSPHCTLPPSCTCPCSNGHPMLKLSFPNFRQIHVGVTELQSLENKSTKSKSLSISQAHVLNLVDPVFPPHNHTQSS